jgi:uncharacterized protein
MKSLTAKSCLLLLSFLLASQEARPQAFPEASGFVTDTKGLLSPQQRATLDAFLTQVAEASSNEIAVGILDLPEDASLEDYTVDLARKWGVGGGSNDNGVLLAIYPDQRKIRIEVGYGLEGAITDAVSAYILSEHLRPAFQRNDYYGGIDSAVHILAKAAVGEYQIPAGKKYYTRKQKEEFPVGLFVLIGIVVLFLLLSRGGRGGRGGGYSGGGWYWGPPIFWGGGFGGGSSGGGDWGGGSGGSWGGGGDFGGFGGGDFGGGGASGDW